MARGDRVQFLSVRVQMRSGAIRRLDRGDPIPSDADPKDVDRLRRIGAIGRGEVSDPAEAGTGGEGEGPTSTGDAVADSELVEWTKSQNMDVVLEAADSPERAAELLAAEGGGKARATLIAKLQSIASGEGSGESGDETGGEGDSGEGAGDDSGGDEAGDDSGEGDSGGDDTPSE